MARVLATGPAGPSNRQLAGSQIGAAFGNALGLGIQQKFEANRTAQLYDPVRQALQEAATGSPSSPIQQIVASITSDPNAFAEIMRDPNKLQAMTQLGAAVTPEVSSRAPTQVEQILDAAARAEELDAAGDTVNADRLRTWIEKTTGGAVQPKTRDFVQRIMPDGSIQTLQHDRQGNFFDLANAPVQLGANERLIDSATLTGGADDLGLGDAEVRELRNSQVDTTNFIGTVGDTLAMLEEDPNVNTLVGRSAAIVNDIGSEIRAMARLTGVDVDERLFDPATHDRAFRRLGIQNQRMRSLITSLAYGQAMQNSPDGRVSNADFDKALQEIGASSAHAPTFAQTLVDLATRADRNFRTNYQVRAGRPFTDSLGLENLGVPDFEEDEEDVSGLSDDELLEGF